MITVTLNDKKMERRGVRGRQRDRRDNTRNKKEYVQSRTLFLNKARSQKRKLNV